MRLLHAADLHLDAPLRSRALRDPDLAARLHALSREALARLCAAARAHRVDALVLAGDVFDSGVADVASRAALTAELAGLARDGIPSVLIRGNHDALLDLARYGPVAEGVHLLDAARPSVEIAGGWLHGLGFEARHEAESLLPRYPAPVPGRVNVGLMHTSLGGAPGHDPYAPCAEADLLAHGYDYWALGHIHARREIRGETCLAVMPGIPQGRHVREPGRGSATLATVVAGQVRAEVVPIARLAFETREVALGGAATQGAALAALDAALRAARAEDHDVAVRLVLRDAGAPAAEAGYGEALAAQAAAGIEGVTLDSLRFAPGAGPVAAGAVAELAGMMRAVAASPGFRDEAAALLAEWRARLPREARAALPDAALEGLIADGLAAVTARLAPAGAGPDDAPGEAP